MKRANLPTILLLVGALLSALVHSHNVIPSFDLHPHPDNPLPPPNYYNPKRNLRHSIQKRRQLTTGQFHNLVLLLRFADHANRPLPPSKHYNLLYNSPSIHEGIVPTGSVANYYRVNSYGRLNVITTVIGWIPLSQSEAYYANNDYGFTKLQEAIIEALNALDAQYDMAQFDSNNDGVVDGFGVLSSGYGAEFADEDCYGAANLNRVWSHKGGVSWSSANANVTVDRYYVSSGLRNKCGEDIARMGVICHELGHYLGLPDLYDSTFQGSGIGALDVMSQSWGYDGTGVYPPLFSAWSKMMAGWVDPLVIDRDGTYQLSNSENSDTVYRIDYGYPQGEYLLLENRQPDGYDSKIPHGGIAIYHIDENAAQNTRGYPGQDSWPTNGKHYKVALLSADGMYDLERGVNQGDGGDLWHASSKIKILGSGSGSDGMTWPNTASYRNGVVVETGVTIYGFSLSKEVMSFKIKGIGTRVPTVVSL
jgi:M6 family metalloprotease-like protein